ncbi:zinc ribbon domain-containing protein [Paenibacillus sp. MZ04-78.2]|nr:zinc ribbon domain-containing protein [Paenibacillus sp. MZ04-78.2]MCP3773580.1 zinc ribbon domain-containing protein [Paenibacillus sp. MZ04-78.2]
MHSCLRGSFSCEQKVECSCGYRAHRDRVGAINILRQPVIDGNSLSA